ncbi:MAG: D-2-hydroxyacid dehydrogenase [Acutalibacteraceae bacterium]|nr:D-2-hydroxyacid dehydrogenase [Acutalibacteraceae bacterium]
MKIIITEGAVISCGDISFERFNKFGEVKIFDNLTYEELEKEIVDTDILLCNKVNVDKNIIDKGTRLKYIGTFATGYNNIDIEYCKQKGITVCNAGSYSTNAIAQQTFGYILNHYCKLNEYNAFVKDGGWVRSPLFSPIVFPTDEIAGKTLGIVGYGSIGKTVAKIARAFDMKVIVYTRTVREDGITKFVTFDELLDSADIITLHCPLTKENADMFNADTFAKCKDGAFFINTARGGLVDESALRDALASGKLSGAAVDVVKREPMSDSCPLLNVPNITITPHSGWVPLTTRQRLFDIVENNISAFLEGNPQNVVSK